MTQYRVGKVPPKLLAGYNGLTDKFYILFIDEEGAAKVRTKHDETIYKTKYTNISANGNIIDGVADKKIRVHFLSIQAIGNAVLEIKDADDGAVVDKWALNTREGSNLPFTPNPAFHYESQEGEELYANFSTAGEVKITIIYSEEG